MHELPGALGVASTFPFVGRAHELERLRALLPRADGEGRRVVLLGGEAGSGKSRLVREFAAEAAREGVARPLRRLRRGRAHALRRRSSRRSTSSRARSSPTSCGAALGPAAASSRGCSPTSPRVSAGSRRRPTPTRTPSATACTRRSPTCSPASADGGRCCSCSRTRTGPTRRRSPSCATWPAPARARGCSCSPPSATPRPTCPTPSPRRSPTCAAPRTSCGCALAGLSGDEVAEFVRRAGGAEPARTPRARGGDPRADRRQRVPRLRALARAGRDRGGRARRRRVPRHRPPEELGTPESVREVVSRRLARLAPRTSDLLELAATAGPEFELEVLRPRRRARGRRAAGRARRGRPQRHDRGAPVASGSPTGSPTSSSGARSTTA